MEPKFTRKSTSIHKRALEYFIFIVLDPSLDITSWQKLIAINVNELYFFQACLKCTCHKNFDKVKLIVMGK